eukprot:UN30719
MKFVEEKHSLFFGTTARQLMKEQNLNIMDFLNEAMSVGAFKNVDIIISSNCFMKHILSEPGNHTGNRGDYQQLFLECLEKWTDMKTVHPLFKKLFTIIHQVLNGMYPEGVPVNKNIPHIDKDIQSLVLRPQFLQHILRFPAYVSYLLYESNFPKPSVQLILKNLLQSRKPKLWTEEVSEHVEELIKICTPYLKKKSAEEIEII